MATNARQTRAVGRMRNASLLAVLPPCMSTLCGFFLFRLTILTAGSRAVHTHMRQNDHFHQISALFAAFHHRLLMELLHSLADIRAGRKYLHKEWQQGRRREKEGCKIR